MKNIVIIPARLSSTRLPRKVLADIRGHPLIWHVWQRVCQAKKIDRVIIATDSEEVAETMLGFGASVLMTSPDCQSGTERIASLVNQLDADLIINVQGDEPLVDPTMLDALVSKWMEYPCDLITPVFPISTIDELLSPNVVKVVRASDGRALYFSRSPIPFIRDYPQGVWLQYGSFRGHSGVYGYAHEILSKYYQLPPSPLEGMERLEQLRFLEAGYSIQTVETRYRPNAVDVLDDLEKVRSILAHNEEI